MCGSICNQLLTIIYKQNSPEEEAELKKLKDIEKSVEQTAKKLEKVDGELTGLKNVSFESSLLRCIGFYCKYVCYIFVPVLSGIFGQRSPGRCPW